MKKITSLIKLYNAQYQEALVKKANLVSAINNYEKSMLEFDVFTRNKNSEFTKNIATIKLLNRRMQYSLEQKKIINDKIQELKRRILELEVIALHHFQQKLAFEKIQSKIHKHIQKQKQESEIKSNESIVNLFLNTKKV